jgi:tetratricopeptide (TPR) repeat protein
MPRNYSSRDIKLLFALSGNRCAFPRCDNPIVADATARDDAEVVGHIAHIVASSDAGPRSDPGMSAAERDREPNLLLLCAHHHAVVDAQASTYTVDDLRRWKQAHRRAEAARRDPERPSVELRVPSQIPAGPRGFVNRFAELSRLDEISRSHCADDGPAVVLLMGTHGVGKSAMSRMWAGRNRGRFPDGQLYTDFRDLRRDGGVAVSDVLGGYLESFGVAQELIPTGLEARTAQFRTFTAGMRLLILLEDVENAAEVTPLIPNGPGSMVVVTGHIELPELVQDRARPMRLRRLDTESAAELLEAMVGAARVYEEPQAVDALTRICDGLPVALRVCGARLEIAEDRPISWLVEELADEQSRLERLKGPRGPLDAVFDGAYRALSSDLQKLYRRLGIHPGASVGVGVGAAVLGDSAVRAAALLERLGAAHLVEDAVDGRYRLHDLLRIHARRVARLDESADERDAVLRRVVDFYVHAARRVDRAISPDRLRIGDEPQGAVEGLPEVRGARQAFAWFEAERQNILAVLRAAADHEWDDAVWHIVESLWACYFNRKPFAEWVESHTLAVTSAQRAGVVAVEAKLRAALAKALMEQGMHDAAEEQLASAARLAAQSEHGVLQASVCDFQGHLAFSRRRYSEALDAYNSARQAYEQLGVPRGITLQRYHAGRALAGLGRHDEAISSYRQAIITVDPVSDELLLGRTLIDLARSEAETGRIAAAQASLDRALEIMRRHGLTYYVARAIEEQAALAAQMDDVVGATNLWDDAHALYAALGSPRADELQGRMQPGA